MVGLCYLGTKQQTQVGIQSVQGIFFMLITENFFTPMYSVMNQMPTQLPLFRREYTSGLYDAPTFYIANILSFVSVLSVNYFNMGRSVDRSDNVRRRQYYMLFIHTNYHILCNTIITDFTFFFPIIFLSCPIAPTCRSPRWSLSPRCTRQSFTAWPVCKPICMDIFSR